MKSFAQVKVEITEFGAGIQARDVGDKYPQVLALEIGDTEFTIGFGFDHGSHVVTAIDRLVAALQEIRTAELRHLGKPRVLPTIADVKRDLAPVGDQADGSVSIREWETHPDSEPVDG